jgi:hypothetical protein
VSRFFAPGILIFGISGLAFMLIAIVIARSPYTHGNLSPAGYNRTRIVYVGEVHPFEGLPLANPSLASTGDPVRDGRTLFFRYGCAGCHGLNGQGGPVGKDLSGASAQKVSSKVRTAPKTMPTFDASVLPDSDLEKVIAFIQSLPPGQ